MNFRTTRNIDELLKQAAIDKVALNLPIPETGMDILRDLDKMGYKGLVVGGAVRDAILDIQSKDIDIEVYGMEFDDLMEFLNRYGTARLHGKSFGVIKLKDKEKNDYDISIPRRDSKVENDPTSTSDASGRGINAVLDKDMSIEEAASRRDYTINSVAYDPLTKELHDYYGGVEDLDNKILRATSPSFTEDPLRVLRGMQFASRFGLTVDPRTAEMCESMKGEKLQKDRVREEWMKFFTKCKEPQKGLQFLIDTEWIDNYPELKGIVDTPQEYDFHPEGTVDIHTGLAMNVASNIADEKGYEGDDKAILVASAMCHDLGKATTTDTTGDVITSYNHHVVGGRITKEFLKSIGAPKILHNTVVPLVTEHMSHIFFNPDSKKNTVMHLAERLGDATIKQLEDVIRADAGARPPKPGGLPDKAFEMIELSKAKGMDVYGGKLEDLLKGQDLMDINPKVITEGVGIGTVLKEIRKKQLRGDLKQKNKALEEARLLLPKHYCLLNGNDVMEATGEKGPRVGQLLGEVWEAQLNNEFNTKEDALYWLVENTRTTDIDDTQSIGEGDDVNFRNAKSIDDLLKKPKLNEKDVNKKELSMGIDIEMEHTTSRALAKTIALHHLEEIPDYYTKLKKMEKEGSVEDLQERNDFYGGSDSIEEVSGEFEEINNPKEELLRSVSILRELKGLVPDLKELLGNFGEVVSFEKYVESLIYYRKNKEGWELDVDTSYLILEKLSILSKLYENNKDIDKSIQEITTHINEHISSSTLHKKADEDWDYEPREEYDPEGEPDGSTEVDERNTDIVNTEIFYSLELFTYDSQMKKVDQYKPMVQDSLQKLSVSIFSIRAKVGIEKEWEELESEPHVLKYMSSGSVNQERDTPDSILNPNKYKGDDYTFSLNVFKTIKGGGHVSTREKMIYLSEEGREDYQEEIESVQKAKEYYDNKGETSANRDYNTLFPNLKEFDAEEIHFINSLLKSNPEMLKENLSKVKLLGD